MVHEMMLVSSGLGFSVYPSLLLILFSFTVFKPMLFFSASFYNSLHDCILFSFTVHSLYWV